MKQIFSTIIYNYNGCIVIRKDEEKVILKVTREVSGGKELFVKIYLFPNRWKNFYKFEGLRKGGFRDYRVCQKLKSLGVPVPDPVGSYGDPGIPGFPRRSLFASRWIEDSVSVSNLIEGLFSGESKLDDQIIQGKVGNISSKKKYKDSSNLLNWVDPAKISTSLGAFISVLQKKRIYCKDLNAGNFLVQTSGNSHLKFLLVDYEGISFIRPISKRRKISNLIQIAAFMSTVDENASHNMCRGYVKMQRQVDLKELTLEVEKRSNKLKEKWKKKLDNNFKIISQELQNKTIKK